MNRPPPVCAVVTGLFLFLATASGETFSPPAATQSVSGQFNVSRAPENFDPFFHPLKIGADTNLLRLEPALLAVSVERFKTALWREIGLAADTPWSGKIYVVLHPARSLDEPVNLIARTFLRDWTYRLELPDVLPRDRYARAFSAVLLLEIANRHVPPGRHSAAVPDWLVAGMGRQIADAGDAPVILSTPAKSINDLPQTRVVENRHSLDPLAAARRVLQKTPALTFDQLSWPDDVQLNGDDGDLFDASAQLFVAELLALKDGPAKIRAFLTTLPAHENWQTAFFKAFKENFHRPLDVEKWWALRVIAFTARDPGPRWTVAVSREKLAALLAVPVDVRSAPNALPLYSEISLQAVIRNFEPARQVELLSAQLRDLELAELRMVPPLNGLAAGYAQILSDYLHARKKYFFLRRPGPETTIQRLDAQDGKRREVEAKLKASLLPADLNLPAP